MVTCGASSFAYNGSLCACNPGYVNFSSGCTLFNTDTGNWTSESGVGANDENGFTQTVFSFNSLKNVTQSQALFLEVTTLAVVLWLVLCIVLRFCPLNDGRTRWFQLRYWLTRLDFFFSTRHWLDEQKIVVKRKTELGGTFSMASLIFFFGLSAALLYQIISKRSVEVQNIRPANAVDLKAFVNDMDFNITTVSSMSCAQLRGLGTLQIGVPGFIDERTLPLSDLLKADCHNTSRGPTIRFQCNQCELTKDNYYISWHFIDVPNSPAAAVGFHFNLTAKKSGSNDHVSVLSGAVKTGRNDSDNTPLTLRGTVGNILKFRLVPRLFHNVHNLRIIQAFFHEFIPGSSYRTTSELQASYQNAKDGMLNVTFHVNFLSDYIVELDTEDIMGPVTFLADLGGLYAISIALFYYLLAQFEYRVNMFRYEDNILPKLEARRRARKHWDKLRKYVMYTWGRNISDTSPPGTNRSKLVERKIKGIHRPLEVGERSTSTDIRAKNRQIGGLESKDIERHTMWQQLKNHLCGGSGMDLNKGNVRDIEGQLEGPLSIETASEQECGSVEITGSRQRNETSAITRKSGSLGRNPPWLSNKEFLPVVPDIPTDQQMDIASVQTYLRDLYEYNVRMREDFLAAQSVIRDIVQRLSPHSDICRE
ncbi:hypothetical protein SUGI_1024020 [Cryptomeria japonica]|uniref:uncharacterized protein LOC131055574 isoform X1 n=1 Tax=Cryptomeria japonica TaxID=3369 RepID=UPI0024148188|nr:uncharacterized protein LOC131055574 isoform X1 [Cryptomeria japonica]GLJ48538.1 hypothetical protein SUGI_1024020 [Cryptomeria japonica]